MGDSGGGKSSIVGRFCDGEFNECQPTTIGIKISVTFFKLPSSESGTPPVRKDFRR
jgi:GTPase SAR1 family protein